MATREGQALSLQICKLPVQPRNKSCHIYFFHLVISMAYVLYNYIYFESPSEISHIRQ